MSTKTWTLILLFVAVCAPTKVNAGQPWADLDLFNIIDVGPVGVSGCTCLNKPFAVPTFRPDPLWGSGPVVPLTAAPLTDAERDHLKKDNADEAAWIVSLSQRVLRLNVAENMRLGYDFANGIGVERNQAEALRWFTLAASRGHADAPPLVAYRLLRGIGAPIDEGAALTWFRLGAQHGDGKSFIALGLLSASGRGVPQDFAAAVAWWRLAGPKGFSGRLLADAYLCGLGVDQDAGQAVALYRELTTSVDLSGAATQLGRMYAEGCGVDRDTLQAEKYYRLTAGAGDPEAQIELSALYSNGVGLLQKPFDAYLWASYAAVRLREGDLYQRALRRKQEAAGLLDGYIVSQVDAMVKREQALVESFRLGRRQ